MKRYIICLSENLGQKPEAFRFDNIELRNGKLYQKGKSKSLMIKGGKLRKVGIIAETLGKEGLCNLGFNLPADSKVTARQAVALHKAGEEMSYMSDITKADDIRLQEITKNAARSMENHIKQLEGESSEDLPMCKLLGLDKQLRSIKGSLKVEAEKRFSWKKESREKSACSRKSETIQNTLTCNEKKLGSE